MNTTQRNALKSAIANAGHDLYCAKLQKKADPNWVSGNGETIEEVVAEYQKHYDELNEGINSL